MISSRCSKAEGLPKARKRVRQPDPEIKARGSISEFEFRV